MGDMDNPPKGKQFLFCEHFIQTLNGTLSSKLAKYKGANDNIHAVNASRLLRIPKIQEYLKERYSDVAMKSDEVLPGPKIGSTPARERTGVQLVIRGE